MTICTYAWWMPGRRALQVVSGAPNVKKVISARALIGANCRVAIPSKGKAARRGKLWHASLQRSWTSAGTYLVGDEGLLVFNEEYELGTDIRDIFGLNDAVADFEILANRPDCLSMWGIARESAAVLNQTFSMPDTSFTEHDPHIDGLARVTVLEPELCPRTPRVLHNVRIAHRHSGCAITCTLPACAPSTLWTSPTMSCWKPGILCTHLTLSRCAGGILCARPKPVKR